MTFEQIIRELSRVPPRELDEWMALRHDQILALNDLQRIFIEDATMELRKWLRDLTLATHAASAV